MTEWRTLLLAGALIVLLIGGLVWLALRAGRSSGARIDAVRAEKAEVRAEVAEATVKAVAAGTKAAAKAKQAVRHGETPADIVRRNDGRW